MADIPEQPRRRRNLAIQIGLTSAVVVIAVAVVLYVVLSGDKKPTGVSVSGETNSIRVASSTVITKAGSTEPKVVLSIYEDFLCPYCGAFEQQFGSTVGDLIDNGAVAVDYYMVVAVIANCSVVLSRMSASLCLDCG